MGIEREFFRYTDDENSRTQKKNERINKKKKPPPADCCGKRIRSTVNFSKEKKTAVLESPETRRI